MAGWKRRALDILKGVLSDDFGDRAPRSARVTWRDHCGYFRVRGRIYIVVHNWRRDEFRVGDTPRRAGLRATQFRSQCETMIRI